jgi:recombination protein RecA
VRDTGDLINEFKEKSDSVYTPSGKTTWRLPTGILTLDKVLGGGFPGGSVIQLYGQESSGKTTLAYRTAAQAVKLGYSTLLIPLEKYSEQYAEVCGIDLSSPKFHVVAADYAELVFNLCIEAVRNYDTQVIIMDSISAARPKADIEKKQKTEAMDKGFNIGTQARAISDFIGKIQGPIRRKEAMFLTVNQLSYRIGRWGASRQPKGGEALQYFSDVKLNMWGKVNKATQDITVYITVDKGKEWEIIPFGSVVLNLAHAKGFDIESDLINACEKAKIVTKKGSWYNYGDINAQGLTGFADLLRTDHNLKNDLYDKAAKANIEVEKGMVIDYSGENGEEENTDKTSVPSGKVTEQSIIEDIDNYDHKKRKK